MDGSENIEPELLLYDLNTPHGLAFDFILNRDTRRVNADDPHLVQRFVLALLFYATGGRDHYDAPEYLQGNTGVHGWDSEMTHFLTGLHECHWVKKSLEDQFWGLLSMESDSDRRVGVTKCNRDMEVTEIRLGEISNIWRMALNLSFIKIYCGTYYCLPSCYYSRLEPCRLPTRRNKMVE